MNEGCWRALGVPELCRGLVPQVRAWASHTNAGPQHIRLQAHRCATGSVSAHLCLSRPHLLELTSACTQDFHATRSSYVCLLASPRISMEPEAAACSHHPGPLQLKVLCGSQQDVHPAHPQSQEEHGRVGPGMSAPAPSAWFPPLQACCRSGFRWRRAGKALTGPEKDAKAIRERARAHVALRCIKMTGSIHPTYSIAAPSGPQVHGRGLTPPAKNAVLLRPRR